MILTQKKVFVFSGNSAAWSISIDEIHMMKHEVHWHKESNERKLPLEKVGRYGHINEGNGGKYFEPREILWP